MKKIIASLFVAALVGTSLAMAGEPSKDIKKIVEEGPYVETSQKGITLSGYVDAGYQYNFNGRGENMNTSPRFGNAAATAGDEKSRGDFDLNAVKLALEKPLSDANELQAGFRIDAMMGEDASALGQNAGGSDSIFLEQAYVQFRLPYGNGIDFKVGKFVTPLGYEVIERPVNLNITYGNIFNNCIPLWHTGFLSSYKIDDTFEIKFGVVNGSNNDNGVGARNADDNGALLAALNITPASNLNWYNAFMYGINGDAVLHSLDDAPMVVYDTYINWKPKFAKDKLLLGVNANIGNAPLSTGVGGGGIFNAIPQGYTTWWGAALYAKYQVNDFFSLANRFDFIHNDDSNAFGNGGGLYFSDGWKFRRSREDLWSETITARFDVIENMMLRLEYRVDWGSDLMTTTAGTAAVPVNTDGPLHSVIAEVVYSF